MSDQCPNTDCRELAQQISHLIRLLTEERQERERARIAISSYAECVKSLPMESCLPSA